MISMAGLQVFIVRFFFQGARKGMSASVLACDITITDSSQQDMCDRLDSYPLYSYLIAFDTRASKADGPLHGAG